MSPYLHALSFIGGLIVRLAVASIFAQSALHALRDLATHRSIVEQYRLVPAAMVPFVATVLPVAMLATSIGLIVSATVQWAALLGAALMTLFTLAILINLLRGREEIDCGCGGAPGQRLSQGLVLRNVILDVLLLSAVVAPSRGRVDAAVLVGVMGGAATLVAFYFATSALLNTHAMLRGAGDGK